MLMALNRHMLHNSLLKVQQHITTSGNILKSVASTVVANNSLSQTVRKSSSSQQQSSSSDSEGDDTLKKNPYYNTYAEKLRALKKKDADAYHTALQRLRQQHQNVDKTEVVEPVPDIRDKIDSTAIKTQPKPNRRPSQSLQVKPKTLDQVMNMDLLHDKSWRDVTEIWLAYHRTRKDTLSAIIPLNQFNSFYNQSFKYPLFVLPLPRDSSDSYEFMYANFEHYQESTSNCTVHMTSMINFKAYKENAPECMTVEYYTDLCNSDRPTHNEDSNDENYVLMRATYDGKYLSAAEAACLVNQLRIYYSVDAGNMEKERLLKLFNEGDANFKYEDLISLVETLSIS